MVGTIRMPARRPFLTLGFGKMIRAPSSSMIQRVCGDVFGQQVTHFQLRKVLDVRRQVQAEAIAVLDDFPRHAEQLQTVQRLFGHGLARCLR